MEYRRVVSSLTKRGVSRPTGELRYQKESFGSGNSNPSLFYQQEKANNSHYENNKTPSREILCDDGVDTIINQLVAEQFAMREDVDYSRTMRVVSSAVNPALRNGSVNIQFDTDRPSDESRGSGVNGL